MFSRRRFINGAIAAGAAGWGGVEYARRHWPPSLSQYPGEIVGANSSLGHKLRDLRELPIPKIERERKAVIVGGGIAGLSAAWWLKKHGLADFELLELDKTAGGNSSYSANKVSEYPWGGHYVPLPGEQAEYVHELFRETGVISGHDGKGVPVYNEYYLCADPEERLFINGRWQESLIPSRGLPLTDKNQIAEFFHLTEKLKEEHAFSIPLDFSSKKYAELDRQTFKQFLDGKGLNSKYLRWYVNYCCRDDYGRGFEHVSAWAGLHYFAARTGHAANAPSHIVLTWPEGNGWLVKQLEKSVSDGVRTNAAVYNIQDAKGGYAVDYFNSSGEPERINCADVIFCAPRFIAGYVIQEFKRQRPFYMKDLVYAPWLVANITVSELPSDKGTDVAWDNVSYYSNSLGYVVATHQNLSVHRSKSVLTYYLPLDGQAPAESRRAMTQKSHAQYAREIAADLNKMHPGFHSKIENVDIMLWGHGMISPEPGFIFGNSRAEMKKSLGRIHFAHSDMSGISIFEEAQYHGVNAAKKVLKNHGPRWS